MIQPPFTCSAELNPVNNYAHLITLNGQREIGESGEINLIGEWRVCFCFFHLFLILLP